MNNAHTQMRTRNAHKHTHTVWASTLDTKRPPAPPDLGVCEIATFRGSRETAIQFLFFGNFRTGRAIFFRQPLNSLSIRFVLGNLPVRGTRTTFTEREIYTHPTNRMLDNTDGHASSGS